MTKMVRVVRYNLVSREIIDSLTKGVIEILQGNGKYQSVVDEAKAIGWEIEYYIATAINDEVFERIADDIPYDKLTADEIVTRILNDIEKEVTE